VVQVWHVSAVYISSLLVARCVELCIAAGCAVGRLFLSFYMLLCHLGIHVVFPLTPCSLPCCCCLQDPMGSAYLAGGAGFTRELSLLQRNAEAGALQGMSLAAAVTRRLSADAEPAAEADAADAEQQQQQRRSTGT
jgi:hypothetical protein